MNKRLVFDQFRDNHELTRVEVSKRTGISMPSILKAVQALMDAHILIPSGEKNTALGRKPLKLRFNADAISAFGVEFEGDRLSIGLVKIDGTVEKHLSFKVAHQFDMQLADEIISGIREILSDIDTSKRLIAGVGIGIPGAVNPQENLIQFAPLIGINETISALPVIEKLESELHWPVFIENDVNTLAIGELLTRKTRGNCPDDLLFISLGTGVGAGLILDGRLRHGCRYLCGEIGYYADVADNFRSRENQGWLESQLNIDGLKEKFAFDLSDREGSQHLVDYIAQILAPVIANFSTFLDIENIILGGVLVDELNDDLISRIAGAVSKLVLNPVRIEKHISDEPGIVGSANLVIDNRLDELI